MNRGRWLLTLAYLVANLLAQGVHFHGRGGDPRSPIDRGDCDDSGRLVASREVADPVDSLVGCPSCQLTCPASILTAALRPAPGRSVPHLVACSTPSTLPEAPLATRRRAPPRA